LSADRWRRLVDYVDPNGHRREVVTGAASGGSVLVVDRALGTEVDRRLLAHLAAGDL
jgi:hypothetical protein